jgi:competence protein ComEC
MGWNTQIWNLLGFAAFMMIWMNPFIRDNLGFQLSFMAMAGILLFAKPMIRSLSLSPVLLHRIWEITALSLAAQVFIIPTLLGQFHQFPLTFIVSSIVAIPAAYVVMALALLNVLLSVCGIDLLWPLLDWSGHFFIVIMKWMAGYNPLMHYSLPPVGAVSLMAMAVVFSIAVVFKWQSGKKVAYLFGCVALLVMGCHRKQQWSQNEILIYHSYKGILMDIFTNGKCTSIGSPELTPSMIEFATRGYRCEKDISRTDQFLTTQELEGAHLEFRKSFLKYQNINIGVWRNPFNDLDSLRTIHYLIIDACPELWRLKEFICTRQFTAVILPAHLDRKTRKTLIRILEENGIEYHDAEEKGFYRIDV